jgi:hypothetical protein
MVFGSWTDVIIRLEAFLVLAVSHWLCLQHVAQVVFLCFGLLVAEQFASSFVGHT